MLWFLHFTIIFLECIPCGTSIWMIYYEFEAVVIDRNLIVAEFGHCKPVGTSQMFGKSIIYIFWVLRKQGKIGFRMFVSNRTIESGYRPLLCIKKWQDTRTWCFFLQTQCKTLVPFILSILSKLSPSYHTHKLYQNNNSIFICIYCFKDRYKMVGILWVV